MQDEYAFTFFLEEYFFLYSFQLNFNVYFVFQITSINVSIEDTTYKKKKA